MGSLLSGAAALLLTFLLALLCGASGVGGQEPTERDVLCDRDGCLVVYFQRKTFLGAWRACKDQGGDLATVKRAADAQAIRRLLSTADLRHARSRVQVWMGLLRQPRQCSATHPLRGFSWTTGDQDTDYTNWRRPDSPGGCSVPRCVAAAYDAARREEEPAWLDGACSVPAEGFLCRYDYRGMCPPLRDEGAGGPLYSTPFRLLSSRLTHVPLGSGATVPCPGGSGEERSAACELKEDGSVGWSKDAPLCPPERDGCGRDNGGCEHFCRAAGGGVRCECGEGYGLAEDGRSCRAAGGCEAAPCRFGCLPLPGGFRCACPEGYAPAPDGQACLDRDECLQSPCEQECLNAPGTFRCGCAVGYREGDGGACGDVDECVDDPCEDACENTDGSYVCHCRLGFSLLPEDQTRCQDIDECQIPGTCEQMCVNYEGGFECYCREGFELLNDNFSCGVGDRSAATTPFDWDPLDYEWTSQQVHTHWPPEGELSEPTTLLDPGVIWVTTVSQEELPPTQEVNQNHGDEDLGGPGTGREFLWTTAPGTRPPNIGSSTVADWYDYEEGEEGEEEETTAPPPHLSTSTISGGAWNWWPGFSTSSPTPGPPEDDVTHSSNPQGESGLEDVSTVVTTPHHTATPTRHILDPVQGDGEQNQSSTWLLVGLLVPISILVVVMVVLGAVYCSRCSLRPRSKTTSDCYHWISGAHEPPAGLKTQV